MLYNSFAIIRFLENRPYLNHLNDQGQTPLDVLISKKEFLQGLYYDTILDKLKTKGLKTSSELSQEASSSSNQQQRSFQEMLGQSRKNTIER